MTGVVVYTWCEVRIRIFFTRERVRERERETNAKRPQSTKSGCLHGDVRVFFVFFFVHSSHNILAYLFLYYFSSVRNPRAIRSWLCDTLSYTVYTIVVITNALSKLLDFNLISILYTRTTLYYILRRRRRRRWSMTIHGSTYDVCVYSTTTATCDVLFDRGACA